MSAPFSGGNLGPTDTVAESQPPFSVDSANLRSCVACAQRKLRCDKQHPCARCRRAGISCISPLPSQRPRWANHGGSRVSNPVGDSSRQSASSKKSNGKVVERLGALEKLVQHLSRELAKAQSISTHAVTDRTQVALTTVTKESAALLDDTRQEKLSDGGVAADLSGSFWSNLERELQSLKEGLINADADHVGDGGHVSETSTASVWVEDNTTCGIYNAILKQPPGPLASDVSLLLPLPSQMPFLLEVFAERVHVVTGVPHLPSLRTVLRRRMSRSEKGDSDSEDALVFAVCFAAVRSMDDHEVMSSFGSSQDELTTRYRAGFECALAKADFLNKPSYELVEAMNVFMTLSRWSDPPTMTYMMTGLLIRMARYLGHDKDGAGKPDMTPFKTEMQRRLWWNLCALDLRATEDQGTELTIGYGSFSTPLPLNINETDIWPEMTQPPVERSGLTSIALLRLCSKTTICTQELLAGSTTDTVPNRIQRLSRLAYEINQDYFALPEASQHRAFLAAAGTLRIFLGRLTLLAFHSALAASPSQDFSSTLCNKLVVAAIEMAEHNHALNSDPSCQPWRWVYRTQQHWHAVVFLLIEVCRREWSPIMERAWCALQSPWLLPTQGTVYKNPSIWVPLKQLMLAARKHREDELRRLQLDPSAAAALESYDLHYAPIPSSSTTFPTYYNDAYFLDRWRRMVYKTTPTYSRAEVNEGSKGVEKGEPQDFDMGSIRSSVNQMTATMSGERPQEAMIWNEAPTTRPAHAGNYEVTGLNDFAYLGNFLEAETGSSFDDGMIEDVDVLGFDWNSWLASAGTMQ